MYGHEFTIVQDFYAEQMGEDGPEVVLVKKNLKTKWYCRDLGMISDFGQAFNRDGNIRIHHSTITVNGEERIIRLPYNKTKELLTTPKPTTPGFNINKK